jgi:hypothetical protein
MYREPSSGCADTHTLGGVPVEITASAVSLNVEDVPLTTEVWGQRAFQVRDPNGVIIELVDWNGTVGA